MDFIDRSKLEKWHLRITYLYVFSMPFGIYFSLKILIIWALSALLLFSPKEITGSRHKFFVIWSFVYVLAFLIGTLYSQAKIEALQLTAVKFMLPLLIVLTVPLVKIYKPKLDLILAFFILGSLISAVMLYLVAFARSLQFDFQQMQLVFDPRVVKRLSLKEAVENNQVYFLYRYFSVLMHPGYRSMYYVFAIAAWVFLRQNPYGLEYHNLTKKLVSKPVIALGSAFLSLTVFLLSARTNFISLFLLYVLIFLSSKVRYRFTIVGTLTVLSIVLFLFNPRTKNTLVAAYQTVKTREIPANSEMMRPLLWSTGLEIIREHWLTGVGTGDLQWLMMEKFAKQGIDKLVNPNYNTHNEFIETWAKLGIWGELIFLIWLAYPLSVAIKQRRRLLLFLMLLLIINFSFELVLNREVGIIFVSFFLSLLLFVEYDRKLPGFA